MRIEVPLVWPTEPPRWALGGFLVMLVFKHQQLIQIFKALSAPKEGSPCRFLIKSCIILSPLSGTWKFFSLFCFFKEGTLLSREVAPLPKKSESQWAEGRLYSADRYSPGSHLRKVAFQVHQPLDHRHPQPSGRGFSHQNWLPLYTGALLFVFISVYLLTGIFYSPINVSLTYLLYRPKANPTGDMIKYDGSH